jgi:predicted glycogen debranching enzyme
VLSPSSLVIPGLSGDSTAVTILEQPLVDLGSEIAADLPSGLRREWLVTNGLGGYASGTIAGPATRRYHGLLIAALAPPVERTVLVGGSLDWASYAGRRYALSTHEYADGTLDPHGYRQVVGFRLDGALPVWTFALADALLERRVWMANGSNTTYVRYTLIRASGEVELEIRPLATYRDFHSLSRGNGWAPNFVEVPEGIEVHAFEGAHPFRMLCRGAVFDREGTWYFNFLHREERARGLDDASDLFVPGAFKAALHAGQSLTLVLSAESAPDLEAEAGLDRERGRQLELLAQANAVNGSPVVQQLVLAADQFLVRRGVKGRTVIAGYHWFNDWGRDTMIALPGLTLTSGRAAEAADILRTFAAYIDQGMLPNNFPDRDGQVPGYNTVDATLWYVLALRAYTEATGEFALVDELLPVLCGIVDWHQRGTRYGIQVDPADGLLRAGEPGVQLTWMDAKVGDWVVTPRIGKPVEIQALWYNALRIVAGWLAERGDERAAAYGALADQAHASFVGRFWRPELGYLADVVDGPSGDEVQLRPNQILALSLPHPLVNGFAAESVVTAVGRALLTPYGLRSLSSDDRDYHGTYGGDQVRRDGAYHQGPVWTWLLGPYVEAHYRVHHDRSAALDLLRPLVHHLRDACVGSVSEILEGDAPHPPRGAVAQAWGVAEMLRVLGMLEAVA